MKGSDVQLYRNLGISLASLLLAGLASAQSPAVGSLSVGAGRVDITPPESALRPGDTILDHLFVRVIVVDNGTTCSVLGGLDQGGVRTGPDVVQRMAQATGCPAENFILGATHTHSSNTQGLGGAGEPNAKTIGEALVAAATAAKSQLRPARIFYGTAPIGFNVNRDTFEDGAWFGAPNRSGSSDHTLHALAFVGKDNLPIAFLLNYAMHPTNFYESGVISADFPGAASRYIERRYNDKTVAVFTQGAEGDQGGLFPGRYYKLAGIRTHIPDFADDEIGVKPPWKNMAARLNANDDMDEGMKTPVPEKDLAAYKKAIAEAGELVRAYGTLLGEAAMDAVKNRPITIIDSARIWSGRQEVTCPGRDRLDRSARANVMPPYKDGVPVKINVGLLRIGSLNFLNVNGEVYSEIALRMQREVPAAHTIFIGLANGGANSGYIYSNAAQKNLTFQVIGSRLKPGCAEDSMVSAAISLMQHADQ